MPTPLLDALQLPTVGPSLLEYAETLAQVAAALQVADARPAALTAAALAAAAAAQRAQDEEVAAFDSQERLAKQLSALRDVMGRLEALVAVLDGGSAALQGETEANVAAAAAKQARAEQYRGRQQQMETDLQKLGCGPEVGQQIGQVHLQARGRERTQLLSELQRAEAELARYRGLPADMAAARAATAEKRAELELLRRRLHEHLSDMQ